jgi:hypothetical protein
MASSSSRTKEANDQQNKPNQKTEIVIESTKVITTTVSPRGNVKERQPDEHDGIRFRAQGIHYECDQLA